MSADLLDEISNEISNGCGGSSDAVTDAEQTFSVWIGETNQFFSCKGAVIQSSCAFT